MSETALDISPASGFQAQLGGPSPEIVRLLKLEERREALMLLESEGLVEIRARKRPRVATFSVQRVREIYFVRGHLLAQVLMLSVPDIGWGSVVGNSLDHGVTYMGYGQDFMAACGLEVVTARSRRPSAQSTGSRCGARN